MKATIAIKVVLSVFKERYFNIRAPRITKDAQQEDNTLRDVMVDPPLVFS